MPKNTSASGVSDLVSPSCSCSRCLSRTILRTVRFQAAIHGASEVRGLRRAVCDAHSGTRLRSSRLLGK